MLSRNHEIDGMDGGSVGRWTSESWDWCAECWRTDRLHSVAWAAMFFWAALVLLAGTTGSFSELGWWDGWGVFFAGAGAIVLVEAVVRVLTPEYRSSWWWSMVVGSVLLGIGLDSWDGLAWVWALVLAAVAVGILRGAFGRKA